MKRNILLNMLRRAINILYETDYENIKLDVTEQNICARLAHHLENLMREYDNSHTRKMFKNYYVDVEYNRMVDLNWKKHKKSIIYPSGIKETIICDLLVHSRGKVKKQENLLALEMKKTKNEDSVDSDQYRLMCLILPAPNDSQCKSMYNTLLGVFLEYNENECNMICYEYFDEENKYILKTEGIVYRKN